jgi:carboxymethylenebutenolidase
LTVDAAANRATYKSGGVEVSGYFYRPSGTGPFPALLVLHGKSGLDKGPQALASWLATQGYVAFAIDYFTPIGITPEKFDISFYLNSVDQAREVQAQGLESLKSLPYVAPTRLGVVGQSLGGYFALILATRDDVKGVISYYGAFTGSPVTRANTKYTVADIVSQVKAPVLMFQGDKDELVPIANADATQNLLINSGKQCEYYTYPGVGHAFDIKGGPTYDANATADSQQKVLTFIKAKLE